MCCHSCPHYVTMVHESPVLSCFTAQDNLSLSLFSLTLSSVSPLLRVCLSPSFLPSVSPKLYPLLDHPQEHHTHGSLLSLPFHLINFIYMKLKHKQVESTAKGDPVPLGRKKSQVVHIHSFLSFPSHSLKLTPISQLLPLLQ